MKAATVVFFYTNNIEVTRVSVDGRGNGVTEFRTLTYDALLQAYTTTPTAAVDLAAAYLGGVLIGAESAEDVSVEDAAQAAHYRKLWTALTGRSPAAVRRLAEVRARQWLRAHHTAVESFAWQLDYRRCLSGAELQQRLARTFPQAVRAVARPPRPSASLPPARPAAQLDGPLGVCDDWWFNAQRRRQVSRPTGPDTRALEPVPVDWRTHGFLPFPRRGGMALRASMQQGAAHATADDARR